MWLTSWKSLSWCFIFHNFILRVGCSEENGDWGTWAGFEVATSLSVYTRVLSFGTTDIWGLDHCCGGGGGACPGRCRMLSSNPGLQFSHVSSTVSHPPPPHPPKPSVTTDLAKCPLGGNIDPELRYHPDPFLFFFLIVCLFRAAPASLRGWDHEQTQNLLVLPPTASRPKADRLQFCPSLTLKALRAVCSPSPSKPGLWPFALPASPCSVISLLSWPPVLLPLWPNTHLISQPAQNFILAPKTFRTKPPIPEPGT